MTNTLARIKKTGKNFEIIVDLDNALKFRNGESSFIEAEGDRIFTDSKKGLIPSNADLESAFGTSDVGDIVKRIVKEGEIQTTQEYRDAEQDKRFKQVVNFLVTNSVDPKSGHPHTPDRIKTALEQAHITIKNVPIESQISEIVAKLSPIIPIKVQTKRLKITIPAIHTGKAYGIVAQYKKEENWLNDGSLEVDVEVPSGVVMDFYDKLNSVTHGSTMSEEIKD